MSTLGEVRLWGRTIGAVALAVPMVWVLVGVASESAMSKTVEWCLYSMIGVLYAIWARALILRLLGWARPPRALAA